MNAIAFLSKQIARYPEKLDTRRATLYLGNLIRMQEEIGTGGAGFRFLYAAFLQEAAGIMQNETLSELSKELTGIGDQWRNFAYLNARICKSRSSDVVSFKELSDLLMKIYHSEKSFFARLSKTTR